MLSVVRSAVDMWSCLSGHPGLLVPLEGLVASELDGSPSLVVVHSYVPGAVTLAQAHLQPTQVGGVCCACLWHFVVLVLRALLQRCWNRGGTSAPIIWVGWVGSCLVIEGLLASELDGSPWLVVVHSYVPGAVTLAQAHLQPTQVGASCCCVCEALSASAACRIAAEVLQLKRYICTRHVVERFQLRLR
jgi:hypothetical protein